MGVDFARSAQGAGCAQICSYGPSSFHYAETLNFLKKNTANAVFLENSWLRGMDLATLKILRGAQTGVHVRLFSAVEPPSSLVQIQQQV